MNRLQGKAAIVTGAGDGIGRHIAVAFAREGAGVVCIDVKAQGLEETARLILELEGAEPPLIIAGSIAEPDAPGRMVADCLNRFGRLDILVNNAANQTTLSLEQETAAHWRELHEVNVVAPMLFAQAAARVMSEGCAIVNISSIVGDMALPGRVAYNTSKSAVSGLTRALAVELGPRGIRVNTIAPGHIMSFGEEVWNSRLDERERQIMRTSYALCRVGRPEEVASVAVFLACAESSFITGESIRVDGGMCILCPEEAVHRAASL